MDILKLVMLAFEANFLLCEEHNDKFWSKNTSDLTLLPLDETYTTKSNIMCAAKCAEKKNNCYNYMYDTAGKKCTLGYWLLPVSALNTSQPASTTRLYSKGMYCNVQELVTPVGNGRMSSYNTAACLGRINVGNEPVLVATRPDVYRSCKDVKNSTKPRQLVQLSSGLVIMCDTVTDGGGWTIFQRRVTGLVSFYRNWTEYKNGFGDYGIGDFYLGNENIYFLNIINTLELRFDMSYKGNSYFARYSTFSFGSGSQGYKMYVGGYSGTAGDSHSTVNNNMKFSTYDVDNDIHASINCAAKYHAGWWYAACHRTNLNGIWGSTQFGTGLNWYNITKEYISVDSCEIKVRQTD